MLQLCWQGPDLAAWTDLSTRSPGPCSNAPPQNAWKSFREQSWMLALHVCFEQREVCFSVVLSPLLRWRLTSLPCERALLSLQGKTFLLLVDNSIA